MSSKAWCSISVLTRASFPFAHAYMSGVIPWSKRTVSKHLIICLLDTITSCAFVKTSLSFLCNVMVYQDYRLRLMLFSILVHHLLQVLMFPSTSSRETLELSGKQNCFPRDHTLSVYCLHAVLRGLTYQRGNRVIL